MYELFTDMFSKQPPKIIDGDYYYGNVPFNDEIAENIDYIEKMWEQKQKGQYHKSFSLCNEISARIAEEGKPFMEIACGTPMGLAPAILTKNPDIPCLLTDINSRVIRSCRHYINRRLPESNIGLASFDGNDIPINDNSFDYVTGDQGLGYCIRNELEFTLQAVYEVYRVLKSGGRYVGLEREYEHNEALDELLQWEEINHKPQNGFLKNKLTWRNIFETVGFKIESADKYVVNTLQEITYINPDDSKKTVTLNSDLVNRTTLFIVRK